MSTYNHQKQVEHFKRYEGNPILTPDKWPYLANSTFNPAATYFDGQVLLVVRVEDMRGFSHLTIARSRDGITNWQIDKQPIMEPDPQNDEEQWGIEDPRIVWLKERQEYAMTYVSFSGKGSMVSLATTKDFKTFQRKGTLLPPEAFSPD